VSSAGGDELAEALETLVRLRRDEDDVDIALAMRSVPVYWRAALAATALAAAGRPVNLRSVAEAAMYSRGTAYRNNRELLDGIVKVVPFLVNKMMNQSESRQSNTELHAELQARNGKIAELRAELTQAESDRDQALAYARDLHQQLSAEFHAIVAEKSAKIRVLLPMGPESP